MTNSNQTERRLLASIRKAKSSSGAAGTAGASAGATQPAPRTKAGSRPRAAPAAAKPESGGAARKRQSAPALGEYQVGRRVWPD
jgi:hypothetical protein